jgi:hypothetical protein
MYLLLISEILIVALALIPAWLVLRRRNAWFWWDYLVPLLPALVFLLLMSGLGHNPSLANAAVELLIAAVIAVLFTWLRTAALVRFELNPVRSSFTVLATCVAVVLLVRLASPTMPE